MSRRNVQVVAEIRQGATMRVLIVPMLAIAAFWHATTLTAAAWREEIAVFRVGIAGDSATASQAEPFRLALEEKLGIPVEIFAARNFALLIDAATQNRIDYAVVSATAYAALWNLCECVEPLAVAKSGDGEAAFRVAVFTKQGGPRTIEDLKGGKLAVLENETVGGDLVALDELAQAGLLDGADKIEIVAFERGDEALDALDAGNVAGYLGWVAPSGNGADTGTARWLAARHGDASQYRIVWRSSEIPFRVHAVRLALPGELKEIVRQTLMAMFADDPVAYDSIEPQYGGGFVAVSQSQFAAISAALARKGIAAPTASRRGATQAESSEKKANAN
jgi:phosphonate transport system substrate-binding protein